MTSITRPLDVAAIAAYSDEVGTSVPAILEAIAKTRRDPADTEALREAFRLIHALKGAASMVGLPALSHLLNEAEELLDKPVTEGLPLDDEAITLLQATVPAFGSYVEAARRGECEEQVALNLSRAYRAYMFPNDPSDDPVLRQLLELERTGFASIAQAAQGTTFFNDTATTATSMSCFPPSPSRRNSRRSSRSRRRSSCRTSRG
jgi:chemotaxis protein histidine kinase CheA